MRRAVRAVVLLSVVLGGCDRVFDFTIRPDAPPPPSDWIAISGGGYHTCALRADHTLWCWGDNTYGQVGLGESSPIEVTAPHQVGTAAWSQIATGAYHTCGLRDDGTVWCWGYNSAGQVGDGSFAPRSEPVQIGTDTWYAVAATEVSTCAIRDDDRSLWCWGYDSFGQLGDGGTQISQGEPVQVASSARWETVAPGGNHTCAIDSDGAVWCWGAGALAQSLAPKAVDPGFAYTAIGSGNGFSCGIAAGAVRCFGVNSVGSLGDTTLMGRFAAAPIASDRSDWTAISVHGGTACAVAADGTGTCWGENRRGQIASTTAAGIEPTPRAIATPATWRALAAGSLHTCGIDSAGVLWCTGDNATGQRGDGTGGSATAPVPIEGTWGGVTAGDATTCGPSGGALWCWGEGSSGQVGDGALLAHQIPVTAQLLTATERVAVGSKGVCDITASDKLHCWGANDEGQLAGASPPYTAFPTLMAAPATAVDVARYEHTCAIANTSFMVCWGRNSDGQLGRGTTTKLEATPDAPTTSLGQQLGWNHVTAGAGHTCGIAAGGAGYCWGRNAEGQLGNGGGDASPFIGAALSLAQLVQIDAGWYSTCAIDASTRLWCWGSNATGQLGTGSGQLVQATPQSLSDGWSQVSVGAGHACAIRVDGSLWCWGDNSRGELGTGSFVTVNMPVSVGMARWKQVSAGLAYTCGIQMDNSLWCWGDRTWGAIGDGKAWTTQFGEVMTP